jgi:hypothetical protein
MVLAALASPHRSAQGRGSGLQVSKHHLAQALQMARLVWLVVVPQPLAQWMEYSGRRRPVQVLELLRSGVYALFAPWYNIRVQKDDVC